MLLSSNRKGGEKKLILKHSVSKDGIMTWIEFLQDYDNNGSEEIRIAQLEQLIQIPYTHTTPGGLLGYIDTLLTSLNELHTLQPDCYGDGHRRRILFANLKGITALSHLIQTCKDQQYNFQASAKYLRIHGHTHMDTLSPRLAQMATGSNSGITLSEA